MDPQPICGFEGDGDIYGLGVRVGIYLQWLASILAESLQMSRAARRETTASARDANATYQLAMLAGLVLVTQGGGEAHAANALEAFITLLFCFACAAVSSLQVAAAADGEDKKSVSGAGRTVAEFLLSTAVCAYGTWLLFVGLDELPRTSCPEVAFFFAPVPLFGWYRTFLKAIFVLGLVGSALVISWWSALALRRLSQTVKEPFTPFQDSPRPTKSRKGRRDRPPIETTLWESALKLGAELVVLLIFVADIELTLAWNHVRGVYSATSFSQLFPLIIGTVNLARTALQLLHAVASSEKPIES